MPSFSSTAACVSVADAPATMVVAIFLMPVAATSCWTPTPTMVEPRAAIWAAEIPATSPRGPTAVTMVESSEAVDALLFDR